MSFSDRIAIVTGSASGIGRAVAAELIRHGATVVLADRDGESCSATRSQLDPGGGRSLAIQLDVADTAAFDRLVERVVDEHGRIDLLMNNAGVAVAGEARDTDAGAWERVLDTNLRGVIAGIRAVYPTMIRQGDGHIFNTACVSGLVPFPLSAAYCGTKHAVVGLSLALRAEAAMYGVRISVVCPGAVETPMFEAIEVLGLDRAALAGVAHRASTSPERCARAILRGVRRNRAIIPVTVHARWLWWAYRLSPRLFMATTTWAYRRLRPRLRGETG